jgi:hypothetical protein
MKRFTLYNIFLIGLFGGVPEAVAFSPPSSRAVTKPLTIAHSSLGVDDFVDIFSRKPTPTRSRTLKTLQKQDVILDPDYSLAWSMFLLGGLIIWYHPCKFVICS